MKSLKKHENFERKKMKERYLLVKEHRIEQLANNCLKLGLREEEPVVIAERDEIVVLLPILNNYGNDTKSGRSLHKSFCMPITPSYSRRLRKELARRETSR